MTRALALLLLLVAMGVQAQEGTPQQNAARRQYAGGRDDSDLTVQALRIVTRKTSEETVEHLEPEGGEYEATDFEGNSGE